MAAAKARGQTLGNAKQALANAEQADVFAESLRAIVTPIIQLPSRKIAAILNEKQIATARGTKWQSQTVLMLIQRLTEKGKQREKDEKETRSEK